jgi:hypothetical protein
MGKGSNVQKAQAARERNQKKMGKSDEERKAASAKAKADQAAFMCAICRQTFMVNAKPPLLMLHVTSKHPDISDPTACFPSLKGYGEEGRETEASSAGGTIEPKKTKKKDENLDSLLDAGLNLGGKKKSTKK